MKKDKIKIRIAFYALFGILGLLVVMTPHIIDGHFFVPEKSAESLFLFVEMTIGYLFYRFYLRKMEDVQNEKTQYEKRLVHSFKYIGETNNIVDIFKRFGRFFPKDDAATQKKEIFNTLLSNLVVSVAKSKKGLLRFIDVKSEQTLKEFFVLENGDNFGFKVSNSAVLKSESYEDKDFVIIESDYRNTGVCCILCTTKTKNIDIELVKSLLNQTHLLYLVIYKKVSIQ